MFKRWISLLVTVTMLASLFSATAFAQEPAQADGTQLVTTVEGTGDAADTADKPEKADADKPETGDTGSGSGDSAAPTTDGAPTDGDITDPEAEPDGDLLDLQAEQELPTDEAIAEQIAAATAALAALPDAITWDAFAAVEAAGAALAAVPVDLQAQVEGAGKLQPAIDALLAIYADALAALDPTADVWENQRAIKTFAEMKQQMDAALYVKPADDGMSLMGDEAADLSWLDAAMLAYADAEACIIPAGGDMSLMATRAATDYASLQEAINNATNGDTVLVKKNLKIEGTIFAENGATYTINTNKKKIELISAQLRFLAGTVTVNGGGTIDGTAATSPIEIPNELDTLVLTLDNITVLSNEDHDTWNPAMRVYGGKSITIQNCTFNGTTALALREGSKAETITIKDTSIRTVGNNGYREAALAFVCDTASRTVLIDNVDIETNYGEAIYFFGDTSHSTNVTIQNSNLQTTNANGTPILTYENESRDDFHITVSNTQTYPALTDEKCTLDDGQTLFLNNATGGSIIASMDDAFAITDSITLTSNYAQIGVVSIPKGKTLDTGDYAIVTDYFILVDGTLHYGNVIALNTLIVVNSTGVLQANDGSTPYFAPKASDDAKRDDKPIYGLHEGAQMSLKRDSATGAHTYTAISGTITIQHGNFGDSTFETSSGMQLVINKGKATVWLASDITLRDQDYVTGGYIHVTEATNASGTVLYEDWLQAIANESEVKLARTISVDLDADMPTLVLDKSVTIDLCRHTLSLEDEDTTDFLGISVGSTQPIDVCIKNGTLTYGYYGEDASDVEAIRVGNKANLTLDTVVVWGSARNDTDATVLRVEDGATASTIKGELYASGGGGVVDVLPGGTFKANGTRLSANRNGPVVANGVQGKQATVELTGADVDSPLVLGEYVTLSMTNCDVAVAGGALPLISSVDGGSKGTNVTITGKTIVSTNTTNTHGVHLNGADSFSMTGVKLSVKGNGIVLDSGNITLNDVTVSAGDAALSVVAASAEGDPLSLTINGGSYTATNGTAFSYGHASGAEARTLTIKSEGAEFTGTTAAIAYSGNGTAPKVQTADLLATPAVDAALLDAGTSHIFTSTVNGKSGTVVAKSLSEAFAIADDGSITLQADYISANESVELTQGQTLDVNGKKLTLKSLTSYGNVIAKDDSLITAGSFVQYGGAGQAFKLNGVTLQRPATLAEGTVLEARPLATWGENFTPLISIVDLCPDATYTHVVSAFDVLDDVENKVLLCGSSGASGTVSIRSTKVGEATVAEITVLEGTMAIYADTAKVLDGGKNKLIIKDGARVGVGNKDYITSTANIEGDLYMPEADVFMAAVALLPENVAELTHEHYDLVLAAAEAFEDMRDAGYADMPIVKASQDKLAAIQAVYLDYYIKTAPVDTLFLLSTDGVISRDGTAQVPSIIHPPMLPNDVEQRMNDTTCYEVDYELSNTDNFTLNKNVTPATISATSDAQVDDVLTLSVYFKGKGDLDGFQSAAATVDYTVLPAKADATLKEVVLTSNTYTVNKQKTSQAVTIPVLFASSNGVVYEDDIYTMTTDDGLTLVGEGKNKLSDVYEIAFDQDNSSIVLTPIEGKTLVKNKTYTGRIDFGNVKRGDDTTYQVPNSALISVKVTDVAPKVTVKVANADLINATERNETACKIVYEKALALSGANAEDVEDVTFSGVENVTITYNKTYKRLTIVSTVPLTKGMTLKPVAHITYTQASGFAPTDPTVSIKITETTPAVKLTKTSATISGKAGDVVTVQLVATNKKAPFNLNQINGVEVLKTENKKYVTNDVATAAYKYNYNDDNPNNSTITITITLQKDVEKSEKLTLRLKIWNKFGNKYLPFTLNVKPLSAKLQKSAVTFNVKSNTRTAEVGVTVTPDSSNVTLVKVGDAVATNGVATVDGIQFTCNNAKAVTVDASAATLVKGTKKYSLTFVGIAKPLTLSVKVVDKYQTVKLSKSSISINTTLFTPQDQSIDYGQVMLKYSDGVLRRDDLVIETIDDMPCDYNEQTGLLSVGLPATAPKVVTVTLRIKDSANVDPKKSTLKLTVKRNDKPLALKVTVYGKLDPLNPESTVTMSAKLSGTMAADQFKPLLTNIPETLGNVSLNIHLADNDVLEKKYYNSETGRYIIGWKNSANKQYGAGKFNINVALSSSFWGGDQELLTTTKPITFTASLPKVKLTAQTVTLYESLPYRSASLTISAGDANSKYEIDDVWLQKAGGAYTVERTTSGFAIRYADGKVDFGSKWKAKDTLKLNVTFLGSSKVYTVSVPIVNVQAQK